MLSKVEVKQITVISGKGGTGKTTITAALAHLAQNTVFADCDVDAADLHILLKPSIQETYSFLAGQSYQIDNTKCTDCGKCRDLCRYDAISSEHVIDPIACEGCGLCYNLCPDVITETNKEAGKYFISKTYFEAMMVHAKLNIAEDNSGKLVSMVRKKAREIAIKNNNEYILLDGPPGTGCPVNAAIVGVNLALVVTEPTLSGIHDLERILAVAKHFGITSAVVINKFDINEENTALIEEICKKQNINCLEKIPYDKIMVESLIAEQSIISFAPEHLISKLIKNIWEQIK